MTIHMHTPRMTNLANIDRPIDSQVKVIFLGTTKANETRSIYGSLKSKRLDESS